MKTPSPNLNPDVVSSNETSIAINEDNKVRKGSFFSELTEDWWAVIIGGLFITGILVIAALSAGLKFTLPVYQWSNSEELFGKVVAAHNLLLIAGIGLIFPLVSSIAIWLSGGITRNYIAGFALIYVLAIFSLVVAGNKSVAYYGIEYVVFGLIAGLLIGNLTVLPNWLKEAARSEFFIKTGLVILGTSILFTDIIQARHTRNFAGSCSGGRCVVLFYVAVEIIESR